MSNTPSENLDVQCCGIQAYELVTSLEPLRVAQDVRLKAGLALDHPRWGGVGEFRVPSKLINLAINTGGAGATFGQILELIVPNMLMMNCGLSEMEAFCADRRILSDLLNKTIDGAFSSVRFKEEGFVGMPNYSKENLDRMVRYVEVFVRSYKPNSGDTIARFIEEVSNKSPFSGMRSADLKLLLMDVRVFTPLLEAVERMGGSSSTLKEVVGDSLKKEAYNQYQRHFFIDLGMALADPSKSEDSVMQPNVDEGKLIEAYEFWIEKVAGKDSAKRSQLFQYLVTGFKMKCNKIGGHARFKINGEEISIEDRRFDSAVDSWFRRLVGLDAMFGGRPTSVGADPLSESHVIEVIYGRLKDDPDAEFYKKLFGQPGKDVEEVNGRVNGYIHTAIRTLSDLHVPWISQVKDAIGDDVNFKSLVDKAHQSSGLDLTLRYGIRVIVEMVRLFNFVDVYYPEVTNRHQTAREIEQRLQEIGIRAVDGEGKKLFYKEGVYLVDPARTREGGTRPPGGKRVISTIDFSCGNGDNSQIQCRDRRFKQLGLREEHIVDTAFRWVNERNSPVLKPCVFGGVECHYYSRNGLVDSKSVVSIALKMLRDKAQRPSEFSDINRMLFVVNHEDDLRKVVEHLREKVLDPGSALKIRVPGHRDLGINTGGAKVNVHSSPDLSFVLLVIVAEGLGEFEIQLMTKENFAINSSPMGQAGHKYYEALRDRELVKLLTPKELFPNEYQAEEREPYKLVGGVKSDLRGLPPVLEANLGKMSLATALCILALDSF